MPRTRLTLVLLTAAGVSLALMQTLVIPALPYFGREFDQSASWTAWIVTGFLLSSSVLTPIVGRLGDAHGKKRVLVWSLSVFGVASLGAAAAWDLPSLVAFRIVQGVGAAVFPLAFAIIRDEFPPERVGFAIGTVSSAFGIGGGVGLVLGGLMLEHLSWHWLFIVGGLPSLIVAALIARCVPESLLRTRAKADWAGAAVLSLALIALLVALSEGAEWGWASAPVAALAAAAAVLLALWIRVERRVDDPLIDLRTLARRGMAATNATTFMVGFAMTGFFVAMPALVQSPSAGFGASPLEAGLLLLPFSVAMMLGGPAGGALLGRAGRLAVLRGGLATAALAVALMAVAHDDEALLCAWLAMMGSGAAFALAAIGALVIDHSRPSETGVAGGMNSIMRTVGGSFGGQIAAALLTAGTAAGFTQALAVTAAAAGLGLLPTLLLRRAPAPAVAPAPA
ncbi:MAG TPA: MFS transporter [Solirubrobacteraceae bacterium]|nr:MFS transporter [Solirubrobacteraceae bacterium]